jgi:hypothetical protein
MPGDLSDISRLPAATCDPGFAGTAKVFDDHDVEIKRVSFPVEKP